MSIFYLKARDTRPIMEVRLLNPDGSAHDLTGSTGWKLHVRLSAGGVLTRDMMPDPDLTKGILRYTWLAADWDAGNVAGYLVAGPSLPLQPGQLEHRMEYEVIGPGGGRLTWPNDGYDVLRVGADIGQG
jgi:hypothetical protein